MINFVYWITSIITAFIISYITYKCMKKIKNICIRQKAKKMHNVKVIGVNHD